MIEIALWFTATPQKNPEKSENFLLHLLEIGGMITYSYVRNRQKSERKFTLLCWEKIRKDVRRVKKRTI